MKKIFALFLCICIVCTCYNGFFVNAEETFTEGYYTYTVTDGKATIIKCDKEIEGDVTVPSVLGGYEVIKIADRAFYNCKKLTGITIENISEFGEEIFVFCNNLKKITFGNGVTTIGKRVIGNYFAKETMEISLSDSVKTIGYKAFSGCPIEEITIPESVEIIGQEAFSNCGLKNIAICDGIRSYGSSAFSSIDDIENVYINSVSDWCQSNFQSTTSTPFDKTTKLYVNGVHTTEIEIPYDCPTVNEYAFCGLGTLTSVVLGYGLQKVGAFAFAFTDIRTIIFGSVGLREIGTSAFKDCNNFDTLHIYGIQNWCKIRFASNAESPTLYARRITIDGQDLPSNLCLPDGMEKISFASLAGINSTAITIPKSVVEIGSFAFSESNITDTYYLGTRSDFEKIKGKEYVQGTIHYLPEVGDLNNDGLFNSVDLSLLRKSLIENTQDDINDVNQDGKFDIRDLLRLKKIIV